MNGITAVFLRTAMLVWCMLWPCIDVSQARFYSNG